MDQSESDYLKGGKKPLTTASSILISSSKYLNSARIRDVVAHEMLRKYGNDVPPAYLVPEAMQAFGEVMDYPYIFRLFEEEKAKKPEFKAWLDARYISDVKAEHVEHCKPGTLGREVYDFITKSGLTLDFQFRFEPTNDLEYFHKRFSQAHDIQHMVTGMGVDPVGEFALILLNTEAYFNYFSVELAGQLTSFSTFLVTSGMMRANLHYPETMPALLKGLTMGVTMGRQLKQPLFYVKWEDYWDWNIADIQEELHLTGGPAKGEWDWVLEAMNG